MNERHWVDGPTISPAGERWALAGTLSPRPFLTDGKSGDVHINWASAEHVVHAFPSKEAADEWLEGGTWK